MIPECPQKDIVDSIKRSALTLHFLDILETMILVEAGAGCKRCNLIQCPIKQNEEYRTSFGSELPNTY